jgi:hypothetical protein
MPARPNCFVVGAPKCGTTSFDTLLRSHPDVCMAPKEPHYFATDMAVLKGTQRVTTERDYLQRFEEAGGESIVGETSPWYLYSREAARNIASFNPSSKVIALLRDPVDLILSLHQMNVVNTTEDRLELADALAAEPLRRRGEAIPANTWLLWDLMYRDVVRYSEQLHRYLASFPEEQVHVVCFEALKTHPEPTMRDVCAFLEIDQDVPFQLSAKNTSHSVRNLGVRRLIRSSKWIGRYLNRISPRVRGCIGDALSLFSSTPRYERDATSEACQRLRRELADEVVATDALVNFDVYAWWSLDRSE